MSLDNIHLPVFVIQDLFKKSLVDLSAVEPKKISKSKEIDFFGGNAQHIVLLVNNPAETFISEVQLTFLSGILNACKLTLEDIAIINIASSPSLSYKTISDNLNPKIILMFGVSPDNIQLPFLIPSFQRQTYNNQMYLSIPDLSKLENDKDLKRKLWAELQQIFSL